MANLSLLFTQFEENNTFLRSVTRELFFDVTLSERPSFTSQLTTNPIEAGSLINDHVIDNPDTLFLEGIISDSKVKILSGVQDIIERGFGSTARSKNAFDFIKQLKENHTVVTVVSGLTCYNNMVITSFTPLRNPTTGKALRFSMQLQKLIVAISHIFELRPSDLLNVHESSSDQIQSTTDSGKQPTKTPTAKVQKESSALFIGLFGS